MDPILLTSPASNSTNINKLWFCTCAAIFFVFGSMERGLHAPSQEVIQLYTTQWNLRFESLPASGKLAPHVIVPPTYCVPASQTHEF